VRDGSAHVAYVLGSKFWRRGIGGAAVRAMLDELAATYGVRRACATLKARNERSLGFLRSLGFAAEPGSGDVPVPCDADELVMYKRLAASRAALGRSRSPCT
jgi:RimJ/RimL family protein N-acetyltransferase